MTPDAGREGSFNTLVSLGSLRLMRRLHSTCLPFAGQMSMATCANRDPHCWTFDSVTPGSIIFPGGLHGIRRCITSQFVWTSRIANAECRRLVTGYRLGFRITLHLVVPETNLLSKRGMFPESQGLTPTTTRFQQVYLNQPQKKARIE
jgi:hypothetical protein